MKFYEITIRPLSAFGTSLKGDTIFGHFCWQAAYDPTLIDGGLETALSHYGEKPFAVFSSACLKYERENAGYVLKRPDLPLSWLFPIGEEDREGRYENMKERKKQKWMLLENGLSIDRGSIRFISDRALIDEALAIPAEEVRRRMDPAVIGNFHTTFLQPHNTINRFTGTTGSGEFAPYSIEGDYYLPETELALFVLIDEEVTGIECIVTGLKNIGRFGFGKDASTGKGRFEVLDKNELSTPDTGDADACYTLAPCVPENFERGYFTPFVRYGKHGDRLANVKNPFKNPVIMADEGGVFFPDNKSVFDKPYIGRSVNGVSKTQPTAVVQGFAPYLPMKLEP